MKMFNVYDLHGYLVRSQTITFKGLPPQPLYCKRKEDNG